MAHIASEAFLLLVSPVWLVWLLFLFYTAPYDIVAKIAAFLLHGEELRQPPGGRQIGDEDGSDIHSHNIIVYTTTCIE